MAVTTWNTAPNYDEWGSDSYWSCADWVQWHKLLKEKFGKEKAIGIWNYAYSQGTQFASHWSCRTSDSAFRRYVAQEGLNPYESAGVLSPVLKVVGGGFDIISGTGDFLSSIGKNLKYVGYAAIVGTIIYIGFKVYKATKE
jgi:hypothetical protein